jgi:regulator of sigma E protease
VLVFSIIVFVHEFGHFSAAKLAGVRVFEFALGFGPSIWKKDWHDTHYVIRAFPLGGFVKVAGMDPTPQEIEDEIPTEQLFNEKKLWQRISFVAAGPAMNFVLAFLLITLYHMSITIPPTIQAIVPDSPAAQAGLQPGDQILQVAGTATPSTEDVVGRIEPNAGSATTLLVQRGKEKFTRVITPNQDPSRKVGVIGVEMFDQQREGLFVSMRKGVVETYRWSAAILRSIWQMIIGKTRAELSGPVGILVITGTAVQEGFASLLRLAILLNVNLGLFNLFPIPLLDGFWIVLFLFEAIRGKPLEPDQRGMAQFVGFALILLLLVFATYQDVVRFFPGV